MGDFTLDTCGGNQIASPSYGFYLGNILSFQKTRTKNPDTVSQYDVNKNVNLSSLNLDTTAAQGANKAFENIAQSKLIFQTNPNCIMDPSKLSTMQDYDPTYNGGSLNCSTTTSNPQCANINRPNIFGCRNRQLSIGVESNLVNVNGLVADKVAVSVNGFTSNNTSNVTKSNTTYLGSLSAYAVQPSARVGYAASCRVDDIGTMAVQDPNSSSELPNTPSALIEFHKLNQNLMICQKSILCPGSTMSGTTPNFKTCWLPLNTMDIKINFPISDQVISFRAPDGYFIKPGSVTYYPNNPTEIILQNLNTSMKTIGGKPNIPSSKARTDPNKCHYNINYGWWNTKYTDGWLNPIKDGTGNLVTSYVGMDIFAPQFMNQTSNIWTRSSNGWNVITDKIISPQLYNYLEPYSKWLMHGSEQNATYVETCIRSSNNTCKDFSWANNQIVNSTNSQLPIIVNPKYVIYGTGWGSNGEDKCDGWKGTQQIITDMRYISSVTITNDTSYITSTSSTAAPNPPIPSVVVVDRIGVNGYYSCTGRIDENDKTKIYGGNCIYKNTRTDYEGSEELIPGMKYKFITSVTQNFILTQSVWTVQYSQEFSSDQNPTQTIKNARDAGLTNFALRYTVYSDNSCMAGSGQVCWLYNDAAHTSPHYTLRTVAP